MIMSTLKVELESKGKYCVFLDADNINNSSIFKTPWDLINYLVLKHDFYNRKFVYIFIDEFQYIKNAWLFLKNIFDNYKDQVQLIVSWSSSLDITKNTEFLTWRSMEFYIDRISFFEFFLYKTDIKTEKIHLNNFEGLNKIYSVFKNDLERYFLEYLAFGWYPEVVVTYQEKDKLDILSSIFYTYIEKDIINFLKIENVWAFNNLIKILSSQKGQLLNQLELTNTLGISRNSVIKYIDILKWTFIFSYLPPYFTNIRKELSKMPKIYWEDLWIVNYVLWDSFNIKNRVDLWNLVENFVYKSLNWISKYHKLYFYQSASRAEIDFVLENFEKNLTIIEVKYRAKTPVPIIFKNFEKQYNDKLKLKIIATKNLLEYKNWIYFIPACLIDFVEM